MSRCRRGLGCRLRGARRHSVGGRRVDEDVALAPEHLLAGIVPERSSAASY